MGGEAAVAVVTCAQFPDLDEDWPLLHAALAARGVTARAEVWSDPVVSWSSYRLAVIRATWDYVGRSDEFQAWVSRAAVETRLVNPASVVTWNADKRYLADLAVAGVAVVPTDFVAPGQGWAPPGPDFVVKPAISAGARDTARYRLDQPGQMETAERHIQRLHAGGRVAMVQPYVASVDRDGETALVYFEGEFGHAINKGPVLAEGRPAGPHPGVAAVQPSPAQIEVAEAALAVAARIGEVSYARIDLLRGADGAPLVIELELIEPALFLHHAGDSEAAAARFAGVLASLL